MSAAEGKESSAVKSKTESDAAFFRPPAPPWPWLRLRVKSAIRPSFSEREKGAKGTLRGSVEVVVAVTVASGGPQPSGLKGTAPTSKPPTIGIEILRLNRVKTEALEVGVYFIRRLKKTLAVMELRF